jgi:hypothetical protein
MTPANLLGKRLHVGIFGPSLCGKSNVGKWLMWIYWTHFRVRSIVLDPNEDQLWPSCALRFFEAEKFWEFAWKQRGCAIFADEMSSKKTKRNGDITEIFTRGRQRNHVVHIMGHYPTNLLPEQRAQIQTYFLFDQMPDAAEKLAREWSEPRMVGCVGLPQFEFLQCDKYSDKATRRHLIRHGIFPQFKAS